MARGDKKKKKQHIANRDRRNWQLLRAFLDFGAGKGKGKDKGMDGCKGEGKDKRKG